MAIHNVTWTLLGEISYEETINYILEEWGRFSAENFSSRVRKVITLLTSNPNIFQATEETKKIRKARISPQTSMFYEVNEDEVVILLFWDNRMNPKNREKLLPE